MPLHKSILASIHRQLWQRFPREQRRRALIGLSARMAPRITAEPIGGPPYVIAGFLTAASGLGASARLCYQALEAAGAPVTAIDLTQAMGQSASRIDFNYRDGQDAVGPGTLFVHVNAPFLPLALWRMGRKLVEDKRIVGCWHWELPTTPPEWAIGTSFVHAIVAASRFSGEAMASMAGDVPVSVVGLPVDGPVAEEVPNAPASREALMTVLTIFNMASGFSRKNPLAAVRAFRHAFPDPGRARLILKSVNLNVYPKGASELREAVAGASHINLDERVLSSADLWRLYASSDVVLSLHRSEGFGLVVAEAMRAGRPVIATDWSGTRDFLDATTGRPVPHRMVKASDPQGEYDWPELEWAEPDEIAAAAYLMQLEAAPELRRALGHRARSIAEERFSLDRYAVAIIEVASGKPRDPPCPSKPT